MRLRVPLSVLCGASADSTAGCLARSIERSQGAGNRRAPARTCGPPATNSPSDADVVRQALPRGRQPAADGAARSGEENTHHVPSFPTFRSQPRGCRGPIWRTREGGKCDMGHPFLGGDTRTPTIRRRGSITRLLARRALGWPAYWSRASSAADRVAQWLTTMR